jgi:hypothetical protein
MPVAISGDTQGGMLGELGRDGTIQGSFRVEMTDVQQGMGLTAGMGATGNTQNLRSRQATLTITGSVLPVTAAGANMCVPAVTQASDNMMLRANISYTAP